MERVRGVNPSRDLYNLFRKIVRPSSLEREMLADSVSQLVDVVPQYRRIAM